MGSPLGDIPIFIAMMNPVGIAAQTQKLKVRRPLRGANSVSRLPTVGVRSRIIIHICVMISHFSLTQTPRGHVPAVTSAVPPQSALCAPGRRDNSRRR